MALPPFAKRSVSRSATAVCGVLGFEQHVGVWAALLCAIGWAIAFDHASYSLRYRYADRAQAWLSQWRPTSRAGNWFIATTRKSVGHRSRLDRSYPIFLMINTASTFAGSAAFVGVGYLLTARWHDGRTDWTSAAAGLAVTGLIVGIALSACANRPSLRGSARWAARRSHCRAAPRATPDRRWSSISRSSPR